MVIFFYFYQEKSILKPLRIKFPKITFYRGIAFRYSIFFLVAITIILFIPLVVGYGTSSVLIMLQAKNDATTKTNQTVTRIENVLQPTELVPQTLVRAMENPNISNTDVIRIAREFILQDPYVFGTCLAFEPYQGEPGSYWYASYAYEKNGHLQSKILGSKSYDYFKMEWYRLPKITGKPAWTEPYYDKGGGDTLMCTYSAPVFRNLNGIRKFVGVLTMDVSLAGFAKIVSEVKVSDTGYGILISKQGKIIVSPIANLADKNILDVARQGKGVETMWAIREMLKGNEGFSNMDGLEAKKRPSFLSYAPVPSTGWSFGIIFPEDELYDDMYSFIKVMSWIFGISITILLITTVLITRRMTRPIVRLVEATHKIGHGEFDTKLPVRKSKDEVAQLTRAFAEMRDELRSYIINLEETTTAKEKIESELKVAHTIQMDMLPRGFLTPDNWDLYAILNPAKAVGGDLYDFFYLDPDHLCIAVGDVAGKGVPAALFMMVTRTLLRAKALAGIPINMVMESINRELCQDNPNQMFVTFFAAVVDLKNGTMEFCNAGHNFPLVVDGGVTVKRLKERHGFPLGVQERGRYNAGFYTFSDREVLVLTTDGITDALNTREEFFSEIRLQETLLRMAGKSAREITTGLSDEIEKFSEGADQADDITILALQYQVITDIKRDVMNYEMLKLKNQLTELDRIAVKIEEISEQWNLPPKVSMELNLVIEELFTNVVFYAWDDQSEHEILQELTMTGPDTVQVRLTDDGKPFNLLEKKVDDVFDKPLEERKIGGLGIHFVREMMSEVLYQRSDNKNIVILTRKF